MVRFENDLLEGVFLRRANRFAAYVDMSAGQEYVHVPNSGRLEELFKKGATVYCALNPGRGRKTDYDLTLVENEENEDLVCVDSRFAGRIFEESFIAGFFPDLKGYETIEREVTFEDSRLDFRLVAEELPPVWVEVKCVTLVEEGRALFPDAPTRRGVRHLRNLGEIAERGERAAVFFVVQRDDAQEFGPHFSRHRQFAETLREAAAAGVEVCSYTCAVSREKMVIKERLPIILNGGFG